MIIALFHRSHDSLPGMITHPRISIITPSLWPHSIISKKAMSQQGHFGAELEVPTVTIFLEDGGTFWCIFSVEWGHPKDHNHYEDNIQGFLCANMGTVAPVLQELWPIELAFMIFVSCSATLFLVYVAHMFLEKEKY